MSAATRRSLVVLIALAIFTSCGTAGLDYASGGLEGGPPPDTQYAIAPGGEIEAINGYVWSRRFPDNVVGFGRLGDFFGTLCEEGSPILSDLVDPRVLYDPLSGRWFLSVTKKVNPITGEAGGWCLAVSWTSDPLGPYYRYVYRTATPYGFPYDFPYSGSCAPGVNCFQSEPDMQRLAVGVDKVVLAGDVTSSAAAQQGFGFANLKESIFLVLDKAAVCAGSLELGRRT